MAAPVYYTADMVRALPDRSAVGHVLISPADISWRDDTLVQPDVFVVDRREAHTTDWRRTKTLLLVVEVFSPGTARYDRFTKRRLYQEVRVPAYWIVDADARVVEIWSPHDDLPVVARDRISWNPSGAAEPFALELEDLFRHPEP